jgi:hypothetical protein
MYNLPRDIYLNDILMGLLDSKSASLITYSLRKETKDGFQLLYYGNLLAKTEIIVRAAVSNIKIELPDETDIFFLFY